MDVEQFLEDLKIMLRDGQELLKFGASGVRERAVTSAKLTDRTVREHPYYTLGVVFGLGMLAGLLVSRLASSEIEWDFTQTH